MNTIAVPRVSVVLPVYNGERMIGNAVRSVLAQSYTNWDLTIGNNCSTDRTAAVAEEFASRDPRIRIYTYPKHVSVIDSHSTVFTLISDEAKYCKILGADDWFFPNCLEEMVKVAEANPTVGMVSSYFLLGRRVNGLALPYPSHCVSGREIVRLRLLKGLKGMGGPSATMIRADIVRKKRPFYNPHNYAGDIEAYLDLLRDYDLGFVHQVLTYARSDEESRTTSYLERVDSYHADDLHEVTKFGPIFLTDQEFKTRRKEITRDYYRMLGRSVVPPRNREFWDYHLRHFKAMGYPPSYTRIGLNAVLRILDLVGNPKRTIENVIRKISQKRGTMSRPAVAAAPVSPARE
ncbi:MAG: glycosyltransferase family 2 protein [Burkholderiales bacterium]